MADIIFSNALVEFSATSVEVSFASDKGCDLFAETFGAGAVGATLPKTGADKFIRLIQRRGLTYAIEAA